MGLKFLFALSALLYPRYQFTDYQNVCVVPCGPIFLLVNASAMKNIRVTINYTRQSKTINVVGKPLKTRDQTCLIDVSTEF